MSDRYRPNDDAVIVIVLVGAALLAGACWMLGEWGAL